MRLFSFMDPAQRPIDPELEDCRRERSNLELENEKLRSQRQELIDYITSPAGADPFSWLRTKDWFAGNVTRKSLSM